MVIGLKPNPNGYTMGDVVKATNAAKTQSTQGQSGNMTANAQQFDLAGLSAQQAAALNSFNPKETEAYRWQMKQGQEAIAKTLTMQGRGSGTVGTNAATKFAGDLNAAEYDKGYTRLSSLNDLNYNRMSGQKQDYQSQLLNLIKTAQGAAGTTSAAEQNFANQSSTAALNTGNNLSTLVVNQGNNQANAQLAQGQNTANLYSGLGQAAGTAAQGYAAYKGYKPNYNQTYTKTNGEFI